jgi:hypothetical protein
VKRLRCDRRNRSLRAPRSLLQLSRAPQRLLRRRGHVGTHGESNELTDAEQTVSACTRHVNQLALVAWHSERYRSQRAPGPVWHSLHTCNECTCLFNYTLHILCCQEFLATHPEVRVRFPAFPLRSYLKEIVAAPVTPLHPQKLALTSPASGGHSVGIVGSRSLFCVGCQIAAETFYTALGISRHPLRNVKVPSIAVQ